jgi:aminopeptidase
MAAQGFDSWTAAAGPLRRAAETAVRESLKVQSGERVLIVTNPGEDVARIALALHDAAAELGAEPTLVVQQARSQFDFADDAVIAAIATEPAVIISISANKIGKDRQAIASPRVAGDKRYDSTFHWLLGTRRSRGFWSPGTSLATFVRAVPIDYGALKAAAAALKAELDGADSVRIESPAGTDLHVGLAGRSARVDDGDLASPGAGGNLPAGEAFISPGLGTAHGVLVYDGSLATHAGTIVLDEPVRVEVQGGFAVRIAGAGRGAQALRASIETAEQKALDLERSGGIPAGQGDEYRRNSRNLGELGIGLNPAAVISGNMLEDEKVHRTCHVAIGSNYDEDAPALIHLDGLVTRPTITARLPGGETRVLLRDGEIMARGPLRRS